MKLIIFIIFLTVTVLSWCLDLPEVFAIMIVLDLLYIDVFRQWTQSL